MDAGIGRVWQTLKETGLDSDTLVVFTSDNGGQRNVGANNGPLRDGKQSMYEGGLKVPFCAVWPDRIKPGSRSEQVAVTMDLYPTLLEAAGVEIEHPIDGTSLLPLWKGERASLPEERTLFFHRREGGERYQGLTIHAVRQGPWKLLKNSPFEPLELYNLSEDPQEQRDLAQTRRQQFRRLSAALRLQIQRGGAVPWQPPGRRDFK